MYEAILERNNRIESAMAEVIDFEELLANITAKPVDGNNLVPYTIRDLGRKFPFLDWVGFFRHAFHDVGAKLGEKVVRNLDPCGFSRFDGTQKF